MILRMALLFSFLALWSTIKAQSFEINFRQGQMLLLPDSNQIIHLHREAFAIDVTLDHLDGIFVNCNPDTTIWRGAQKRSIPDFESVGWKVSVETEMNKDAELFINQNDNYCYWFYDPKNYDWHRFDTQVVNVNKKKVIGTKTVAQFFDTATGENKSFQAQQTPLYLTFFSVTGSFTDENAQLDQVRTFILVFED